MATSVIRGRSIYTVVDGKFRLFADSYESGWYTARDEAMSLGGNLVEIEDSEENQFLVDSFKGKINGAWTGGVFNNGIWKWDSGSPLSWSNWGVWQGDSLSQPEAPPDLWDKVVINIDAPASWNWRPGSWMTAGTNWHDDYYYSLFSRYGIAEIPLFSSIARTGTVKEGAGLFTTSINLSAGTQTSGNLAEGATVYWKATGITSDDLSSGSLSGTGVIANGKLDVQHSLVIDADTGEQFSISVYSDSAMTHQIGSSSSTTAQEATPTIRGNSLYKIVSGQNWLWTEAQQISRTLGGDLTTINDQAEWDWFRSEYSPANGYAYANSYNNYLNGEVQLWVGLNDVMTQGQYVWESGQTSTVAFGDLVRNNGLGGTPSLGNYGIWQWEQGRLAFYTNDAPSTWADYAQQIRGVVEIPLISSITRTGTVREGAGLFTTSINLSAGTAISGNLAEGAQVYWKIDGITADDLGIGPAGLTGSGVITNGRLDIQHSLIQDADKGENLIVSVYSDSAMTLQIGTSSTSAIQDGDGTLSATTGSGAFNEGVTLSAGTISGDPDGNGTITAYQWYFNGTAISGAMSSTLAVGAQGTGTYKVDVTYTDGQGYSTTLTSADQAVAKIDNNQGTLSAITGNGALQEGVTLTAGTISGDPDGNGTITAYQWFRNGTAINAATASIHLVPSGGNGSYTVRVSYTDGQGYSTNLTSAATTVIAPPPPADTTAPTLSGISVQGTTVILQFSEAVAATSVSTSAFTVATVSSSNQATSRTINTVSRDLNDPSKLILTLTGTAPAANVNLRVSYTDPAGTQSTGDVQDISGNDLASFSNRFADTFITGSTTTLASQYQNLILTGTSGVSGTGNALANAITGNSANNTLSGLAGIDDLKGDAGNDTLIGGASGDLLTGGIGNDQFRYALTDSLLASMDRITDLVIGTDTIDGPRAVTAANLRELGTVTALTQAGIAAVLTNAAFVANGAATFSFGTGGTARTFLALNNGTAGFSSTTDGLVEITGYSGALTNLAVI